MGQKISEPNAAELAWIAENVAAARDAVVAAGIPLEPEDVVGPAALDAAWSAWLAEWRQGEDDPNPAINVFGLAFGQWLVDHLGLSWKVVQDGSGTEIAVHGQPGDILVFPPNLVAKRLETRATDFFVPVAAGIEEQVATVRSAHPTDGGGFGRFFRRGRDR